MKRIYEAVAEASIPPAVRFDVPKANQGQIVEVAYGGFSRAEHGPGDPYKRVTDRSTPGIVKFFRLRED